jgi:hypothetical protein
VVVIPPHANYIVDTTYAAGENLPGDLPKPPAEALAPVLTSVQPDTLPVWAQDTDVFWNGSNFTENSKIIWNNNEEPTTFISATKLSTIVKPSTVQAPLPCTLETYVVDSGKETTKKTFTFIT